MPCPYVHCDCPFGTSFQYRENGVYLVCDGPCGNEEFIPPEEYNGEDDIDEPYINGPTIILPDGTILKNHKE